MAYAIMPARKPMFYSGLFCIAFGCAVMWYFQHTGAPKFGFGAVQCLDKSTGYTTDYAMVRLTENIHKLTTFGWDSLELSAKGTILTIGFASFWIMRARPALGLTFLALLIATVIFGIVDEERVYIPFVALLVVASR